MKRKRYYAWIGTAGRSRVPTLEEWLAMRSKAEWTISVLRIAYPEDEIILVSGGAAWSDHIAVVLFKEGKADGLILRLPGVKRDQDVAEYYSKAFLDITGCNRLKDIADCRLVPEYSEVIAGNFKDRNLKVAEIAVDGLFAFTYGPGDVPADGGTSHTWANHKRLHPDVPRVHFSIQNLESGVVSQKGGESLRDRQMQLFADFVQMNRLLADGLVTPGLAVGLNPKLPCNNCGNGVRVKGSFGQFDYCSNKLACVLHGYRIEDKRRGNWDSLSEEDQVSSYLDESISFETLLWKEHQEEELLNKIKAGDPSFERRKGGKTDFEKQISAPIYENRAMFIYGPSTKAGEDYKWSLNPDRCIFHTYNEAALRKRQPEEKYALAHLKTARSYPDGKKYHLSIQEGVDYIRSWDGRFLSRKVWLPDKKDSKGKVLTWQQVDAYFPRWLLVNPITGFFTWRNLIDWNRRKKIQSDLANKLGDQVPWFQIRQIAQAQFERELGAVWEYFDNNRGITSKFLELKPGLRTELVPEVKRWLGERGIEPAQNATAQQIFSLYSKEKRVQDRIQLGCPVNTEQPPIGGYAAFLSGNVAVTGKGKPITEEVQKGFNHMYYVLGTEAWQFNLLSEDKRRGLLKCRCHKPCSVPGGQIVLSLEKFLEPDYGWSYAETGCERPKELHNLEKDLLEPLASEANGNTADLVESRPCNMCGKRISVYNEDIVCWACGDKLNKEMEDNL